MGQAGMASAKQMAMAHFANVLSCRFKSQALHTDLHMVISLTSFKFNAQVRALAGGSTSRSYFRRQHINSICFVIPDFQAYILALA
jgi:hypothetical protein